MASNRIIYSQAGQTGKMLAQSVNQVLTGLQDIRRIKAILDAASSGSDWAAVAAEVGGGITTGQAQDLWTIVSTAAAQIDSGQVLELARLDQG